MGRPRVETSKMGQVRAAVKRILLKYRLEHGPEAGMTHAEIAAQVAPELVSLLPLVLMQLLDSFEVFGEAAIREKLAVKNIRHQEGDGEEQTELIHQPYMVVEWRSFSRPEAEEMARAEEARRLGV